MTSVLPRVLILDYYDSYTRNLITLFSDWDDEQINSNVTVVKSDQFTWDEFKSRVLPELDCIILSPGPGRPDRIQDFGFGVDLIHSVNIPVLGVCLGHQGIATAFAGKVVHAPEILHGQTSKISHDGTGLFHLIPQDFEVITYNSLAVEFGSLPGALKITATATASTGEKVIMGLQHTEKPIFGIQFHPESIKSTHGAMLLKNFLSTVPVKEHSIGGNVLPLWLRLSHLSKDSISPSPSEASTSYGGKQWALLTHHFPAFKEPIRPDMLFSKIYDPKSLGGVWLDSSKINDPSSTSFSYLSQPSIILSYNLYPSFLTLYQSSNDTSHQHTGINLPPPPTSFWDLMNEFQNSISSNTYFNSTNEDVSDIAGWKPELRTGLVGWFSYEMKDGSLDGYHPSPLPPSSPSSSSFYRRKGKERETPDACFAVADKVLVYCHETSTWMALGLVHNQPAPSSNPAHPSFIESTLANEGVQLGLQKIEWDQWIQSTEQLLTKISIQAQPSTQSPGLSKFKPDENAEVYTKLVDEARSNIKEGESYELTLTTTFRSSFSDSSSLSSESSMKPTPLSIYLHLRANNPAPYSSFFHFPLLDLSIISSSPERFIKITKDGFAEMRPIKGTIGRCKEDPVEDERRKKALSEDKKEIAENLMIVDLIRADLLTCCIPSSVKVPKLIHCETYDHVHTLVTTVTGQLQPKVGTVEAVKMCFPPGSMTGSPKLRSVQILDQLEGRRKRGIYSGALGYLSFDGAADLSVVIRTIVANGDDLTIGAGGAITWLSDRQREWEEVLVKVGSVTRSLVES